MSAAFDTLRLARNLRDRAQFTPEQAEGVADALGEALQADLATESDLSDLATKSDLRDLATKSDLRDLATKDELREVELRLEAKIEATKADLLKWVVGIIGFQTIIVLGAALALARAVAH